GPVERVAAGALSDDAAVQARAQVVAPRPRGVGASDHVLAGCVVKVSVLHGMLLLARMVKRSWRTAHQPSGFSDRHGEVADVTCLGNLRLCHIRFCESFSYVAMATMGAKCAFTGVDARRSQVALE